MPSFALLRWRNERVPRLAALEAQVAALPPSVLTDENLRALVAMLSAHFQGFCRDLYTEAAFFIAHALPPNVSTIARNQFTSQLALGTGNPNLANLIRDFDRFGLNLRSQLDAVPANPLRVNHLALLNQWRNHVVHDGTTAPPGPPLALPVVGAWLALCDALAAELDRIMYDYILAALGVPPW